MNRRNSSPFVLAGALLICLVPVFPQVFAALVGIGIIVVVAGFVLAGFVFILKYWKVHWPVGVLIGVLLIGLVWPPALGLVVGLGAVGWLFMAVYSAIRESSR